MNNIVYAIKSYLTNPSAIRISAIGALIGFLVHFIPALVVCLLDQTLQNKLSFVLNLLFSGIILFIVIFVILIFLYQLYLRLFSKFNLIRNSTIQIRSSFKNILKRAGYLTVAVTLLLIGPTLLQILLVPDHPDFSQAFKNILIIGLYLLVYGYIGSLTIILIVFIIRNMFKTKITDSIENNYNDEKEITDTQLSSKNIMSRKQYIFLFAGSISGILYIMYYVGRSYYEGYFYSLGIPKDFISFQLYDYIYFGAQVDTIIITLILAAILVKTLTTVINPQSVPVKKGNRFDVYFNFGIILIYCLFLCYWTFLQIFRPDLVVQKEYGLAILLTCVALLGFLSISLYSKSALFLQIVGTRNKRIVFVAAAIITLIFSPYMSGKGWGLFKGIVANTEDFPLVELYTDIILSDNISWINIDNSIYKSNQNLYLIAKTDEYFFLKSSSNSSNIYTFTSKDILSIKIINDDQ